MTSLSSIFQISIFALTALTGGMLALAEESFFPTALTVPLAWLAWFFCEYRGLVRLTTKWSNAAAAAGLVAVIVEFLSGGSERRLLAGAHLLVYLTWIVLFQKKGLGQYWWLLALGVLQVAVGSILTQSGWYGALLAMYLPLALWTLSVYSLFQGEVQFGGATDGSGSAKNDDAGEKFRRSEQSAVLGSIQHDDREGWINARFVAGTCGLSVLGVLCGFGIFLFAPRFWLGNVSPVSDSDDGFGVAYSGFSEEVKLGSMGNILESTARAMVVSLFDENNRRIGMEAFLDKFQLREPLFRGLVLETYSRGNWKSEHVDRQPPPLSESIPQRAYRQEITLEPIGTEVLFAMPPVYSGTWQGSRQRESIGYDRSTRVLLVHRRSRREPISYSIYSAIGRAQPPDEMPARWANPVGLGGPRRGLGESGWSRYFVRQRYLDLPETGLERLRELAEKITLPDELPAAGNVSLERRKALVLERYLRDSGIFTYTLNTSLQDKNIDPVEDFLFNRKAGHCEYFASSLTLMLRAIGIPSRVISGYKGCDYNTIGGYYEVQQRHAHTWVEAFIDDDWTVLDATPAARDENVESLASSLGFWQDNLASISSLWRTYVVNLNISRQRDSFFTPLQAGLQEMGVATGGPRSMLRDLFAWLRLLFTSPEQWFSWRGGVTAFVLMLMASFAVWIPRKLWLLARRKRLERGQRAAQVRIDFYERFLKVLAREQLAWRAEQTQREFARDVEAALSPRLAPAGLAELPGQLADAFYRVRFGALPLEPAERQTLARQLDQLEACLARSDTPS